MKTILIDVVSHSIGDNIAGFAALPKFQAWVVLFLIQQKKRY